MARHYYTSSAVNTTITADINSSVTSVAIASSSGLPSSYPYYLTIGTGATKEVVEVTNRVSLTLTVVRGQSGTTATSHTNGTSVKHQVPSDFFNEASVAGKGLVAWTALTFFADTTAETLMDSITFTAESNRIYKCSFVGGVIDNQDAGANGYYSCIRAAGGSSVTTSGTPVAKSSGRTQTGTASTGADPGVTVNYNGLLFISNGGTVTVGVFLASSTANPVRLLTSSTIGPNLSAVLYIEDIGPNIADTGN